MSQLHSGQKKSQQKARNHSNTHSNDTCALIQTHQHAHNRLTVLKKPTLQSAFNYLYGYLCKRLIITLQIPVKKLVYMQGLVTPQDLGFLQCKVSSTKSLLNWIWDMCKYISRCAQINCMVTINVLCTWSVLKVKSVFLSVLWEQLCLVAMDNSVVTFTFRQIFAFEIQSFQLESTQRGISRDCEISQWVQIGHVISPHWPTQCFLIKNDHFSRNPSKGEFHVRVKYFATCSNWSCEFATLTNRKLLGLKVTSVWIVLHTSLHYWQ